MGSFDSLKFEKIIRPAAGHLATAFPVNTVSSNGKILASSTLGSITSRCSGKEPEGTAGRVKILLLVFANQITARRCRAWIIPSVNDVELINGMRKNFRGD